MSKKLDANSRIELERKSIKKVLSFSLSFTSLILITFILNEYVILRSPPILNKALILLIPTIAITGLLLHPKFKYIKALKQLLIYREAYNTLNPNWPLYEDKYVSSYDFNNSLLFDHYYENYNGDFLTSATSGNGVSFKASELDINYTQGGENKEYITLFKGVFFHAPLQKPTPEKSFICSNYQRVSGFFGSQKNTFKLNNTFHKISTQETDQAFRIYTNSITKSSNIISQDLMIELCDFQVKHSCIINISIINNRIYSAFDYPERKQDKKMKIEFIVDIIQLNLSIIDHFNTHH